MLHRKGQKIFWTDLSLLGQEPTFNVSNFTLDHYQRSILQMNLLP